VIRPTHVNAAVLQTAAGYIEEGFGSWPALETSESAAGALVSTAEDVATFTAALFGGEVVSAASLEAMVSGGVSSRRYDDYGLGVELSHPDLQTPVLGPRRVPSGVPLRHLVRPRVADHDHRVGEPQPGEPGGPGGAPANRALVTSGTERRCASRIEPLCDRAHGLERVARDPHCYVPRSRDGTLQQERDRSRGRVQKAPPHRRKGRHLGTATWCSRVVVGPALVDGHDVVGVNSGRAFLYHSRDGGDRHIR
jgi:hypothetical protein